MEKVSVMGEEKVVILREPERAIIIHMLVTEHDRIKEAHGTHYGPFTIEAVEQFIKNLEKYDIALVVKGVAIECENSENNECGHTSHVVVLRDSNSSTS